MRVEVLLTAVVGLGTLSIDMFLPSLPAIAHGFGARPATAQLYSIAVGHLCDETARPMTTAIALAGTLACVCFWRLRLARAF